MRKSWKGILIFIRWSNLRVWAYALAYAKSALFESEILHSVAHDTTQYTLR